MMRSFGSRADCAVWDEPFYAAYLAATGMDHPMRAEILDAGEQDPAKVAKVCASYDAADLHYQKHMTQHIQNGWLGGWAKDLRHAFLIRSPERVLASFSAKLEDVTLEDIGFLQQAEIFDRVAQAQGKPAPVVEAEDVRRHPEAMLRKLCSELGITFDAAMLSWPKGRHDSDGVWAPHWYGAVENSTGFSPPPDDKQPQLTTAHRRIADAARPAFDALFKHKIQP